MNELRIINLTPENIVEYGVCGYKNVKKHLELEKKIEWFKDYYPKGLRIKVLSSQKDGYQGMIEYIPGEYVHRPVDANGYLFIHCIFVGFKKEFKGKGHGGALIDDCINEAKSNGMRGVSVVTRKGSFMAHHAVFLKKGFQIVDKAKPDFELLVKKFNGKFNTPNFKTNMNSALKKYKIGLTIFRSAQCPYTEKNVKAILDSANEMKLKTKLIDLKDSIAAQNSPSPFGSFCLVYNGEILSYHPISNTRFKNIMNKMI